jgi:kynurenine formamidase
MDYLAFDYHSDTYSHIDALCHVAFEGCLYNGHPAAEITSRGAAVHGIEALKDGLVGRGVLLDIPRLRGASWLEPGEHVLREELEAAERAQGVTVDDGDTLLVRTGHTRRLAELGPWDTTAARAGLHPTAMPFVAERRVAALGSDGTATPRRARPKASPSPSTCWRSMRWASVSWTTRSWRTSPSLLRRGRLAAGHEQRRRFIPSG